MHKILKYFLAAYKDDQLEIQKRAKSLISLIFILIIAIIFLNISSSINSTIKISTLLLFSFAIGIFIFTLFLIKKGQYKTASNIFLFFLFIIVNAFKYLAAPQSAGGELNSLAFYLAFVLFLVLLFSYHVYQIIVFTVLAFISMLVLFFIKVRFLPLLAGESSSWNVTISCSVLITLCGIGGIVLKRIFDDILKIVDEKSKKNLDLLKKLSGIINKSKGNVEIGEHLISIANESSASIEEICRAFSSNRDNLNQLNSELQESAAALMQMTHSINSISEIIEKQNNAVDSSSANITSIVDSIKTTSESVQNIKKASDLLSLTAKNGIEKKNMAIESVKQISNYIDTVFSAIEIIDNVASRLNLLSMNAAIEAAHAGDTGRGFAVVANEMRKLSEETVINSRSISNVLKKMVSDIQVSIKYNQASGAVFNELDGGVTSIINAVLRIESNVNAMLVRNNLITESVKSLMTITGNVNDHTAGIKTGINNINGSMGHIANLSTESYHSIEETSASTKDMLTTITDLLEIGNRNKENILLLNNELQRFNIDEIKSL